MKKILIELGWILKIGWEVEEVHSPVCQDGALYEPRLWIHAKSGEKRMTYNRLMWF